jgi:hypothetical protein
VPTQLATIELTWVHPLPAVTATESEITYARPLCWTETLFAPSLTPAVYVIVLDVLETAPVALASDARTPKLQVAIRQAKKSMPNRERTGLFIDLLPLGWSDRAELLERR